MDLDLDFPEIEIDVPMTRDELESLRLITDHKTPWSDWDTPYVLAAYRLGIAHGKLATQAENDTPTTD